MSKSVSNAELSAVTEDKKSACLLTKQYNIITFKIIGGWKLCINVSKKLPWNMYLMYLKTALDFS